jgi:hypothetical protein
MSENRMGAVGNQTPQRGPYQVMLPPDAILTTMTTPRQNWPTIEQISATAPREPIRQNTLPSYYTSITQSPTQRTMMLNRVNGKAGSNEVRQEEGITIVREEQLHYNPLVLEICLLHCHPRIQK